MIATHNTTASAIEGAVNFRDAGGGSIAPGRLFRCGYLTDVTPLGWKQLQALGIRSVFDLREPEEIKAMPSAWWPGVNVQTPRRMYPGSFDNAVMMLWGTQLSLEEARARRLETYQRMPREFAASIGSIFRQLSRPGAFPAVVHCMGGKDRSGFIIALLLALIGVPRAVIVQEYLRTAEATSGIDPKSISKLKQLYKLETTGTGSSQAMMESVESHLLAAIDAIDRDFGGLEAYLLQAAGLSQEELVALRKALKAPAPTT